MAVSNDLKVILEEVDIIIVGDSLHPYFINMLAGGAAGCVIAGRLGCA